MPRHPTTADERSALEAHALLEEAWQTVAETPVVSRQLGADAERLPDIGFDAAVRRARIGEDLGARIDRLDTTGLDPQVALTLAAARRLAGSWAREAEWYWLAFDPLGEGFFSMFAPSAYSGGFLLNLVHHSFETATPTGADGAARHLETIGEYARLVRQLTERTAGQADRGIRIPRLQLRNAVQVISGLRGAALQTLHAVSERSSRTVAPAERERFDARIAAEVAPAFDGLLALLDDPDYASKAPETVGLGSYPGGAEIYEQLVGLHTTLELSARDVHERGHARMVGIEAEMRELIAEEGVVASPAEYLAALADDPAWRADTDEGIAAHFERYIDRFAAHADEHFGVLPAAGYGVAPLPRAVSGSMTFGYYSPPEPDRDRGLYLFNGANLSQAALPMIAALNYHELVPGHHLHLALQHESPAAHPLRRYTSVTAFAEGWAEYAARFAGEIGMYESAPERFGRLMMEAFLTSRLVVDTGMNALGWSLERAREYMREHSFLGGAEIDSETLRYSCDIPAQALAYKLGDDYLFALREELRDDLGERFSVADFHDAVLRAAGLPLPLVAASVRGELR